MTSTPNVLTTVLRDLLYNQCIDNTCCYSFYIYPTGRTDKIRFVSTGENRGKPCMVCKKICFPSTYIMETFHMHYRNLSLGRQQINFSSIFFCSRDHGRSQNLWVRVSGLKVSINHKDEEKQRKRQQNQQDNKLQK